MGYIPKSMKNTGSIPMAVLFGVCMSLLVTVLGSGGVSFLIHREVLSETAMIYGVIILLLISSYMGGVTGYRKVNEKRLLVSMLTALIYFLILMIMTAIVFEGKYSGIGVTGMVIFCGAALAALPKKERSREGKRHKIKIPSR